MVEILWKSKAPHSPIRDHELVELELLDLGCAAKPNYLVREIHAAWSARAQQIEWKGFQDEVFGSLAEAKRSFVKRKASVAGAGFTYTTVLG